MAALVNVTAPDLQHAVATFDAAMDPASLTGGLNWAVTVQPVGAMPVTVLDAVVRTGNLVVDLAIGAAFSAGQTYTVKAVNAKDAGGNPLADGDKDAPVTAPVVDEPSAEWPHGGWRTLTRAIGQEIQDFSGRPRTLLARDLDDGDTAAFVETVLGWGDKGGFWAGGRRYSYTNRTDVAFLGLTVEATDATTLPAGTEVVCDVAAHLPD